MEDSITQTCIESSCKAPFVIEEGERASFERLGLHMPKRCKECRNRRKAAAQALLDEQKA